MAHKLPPRSSPAPSRLAHARPTCKKRRDPRGQLHAHVMPPLSICATPHTSTTPTANVASPLRRPFPPQCADSLHPRSTPPSAPRCPYGCPCPSNSPSDPLPLHLHEAHRPTPATRRSPFAAQPTLACGGAPSPHARPHCAARPPHPTRLRPTPGPQKAPRPSSGHLSRHILTPPTTTNDAPLNTTPAPYLSCGDETLFSRGGITESISRRADCVESPSASRHAPKRVAPPPARAKGAVGLDAMLGGGAFAQTIDGHTRTLNGYALDWERFSPESLFAADSLPNLYVKILSPRRDTQDRCFLFFSGLLRLH